MSERSSPLTVVVRRGKAHGRSIEELFEILKDRHPNHDIRYADTPKRERELFDEADIVVGQNFDGEELQGATNLRLFACGSAGVNHLPLEEFKNQDVVVTNASGVHGPNVAEHILCGMLVVARRFDQGMRQMSDHEWHHYQSFGEVNDSTITVVGLGKIGQTFIKRLEGFDVSTIGVRYTPSKGGPTDEVIGFDEDDLHSALSRTDYLVIACPLTETTRGLIGRPEVMTLPTSAVIINVARGPVIDADALEDAVRHNWIRAAVLDVTDPEPLPADSDLWEFDNALITPHVAGGTPEYWPRRADILSRNIEYIVEHESFTGLENQVKL